MAEETIEETIPIFGNVADVYPAGSLEKQSARYAKLTSSFTSHYGTPPLFIARAPGRVNLIGEHIDYSLFSVLPMAIEHDIVIAVRVVEDPKIKLRNVNGVYGDRQITTVADDIAVEKELEWSDYFKCGVKGILEHFGMARSVGMECLVDGIVPSGAGVSSSSAFVVCSAIATMHANGKRLNKRELAEIAIRSERYMGMESGGMDQTTSIFSTQTSALFVSFYPSLGVTPVHLPEGCTFVVANSLVVSDKKVTAPRNYNLRVAETRLAALLLAKHLGLEPCLTLKELCIASEKSLDEMVSIVNTCLKKEGYSLDDIAELLEMDVLNLKKRYLAKYPVETKVFKLWQRATHVFTEARRVEYFKEACEQKKNVQELGMLMNKSQTSCRDLFECSCEDLDKLTELCLRSGAVGSRLTGAGWGGCTVSLVQDKNLASFISEVKEKFYMPRLGASWKSDIDKYLFSTKPGCGAGIVKL